MATKKRLVDANAFHLRVSKKKMSEVFPNWKELPNEVQDAVCKHGQYMEMLLETQSTVDAVEVVRCKDCAHRHKRWSCQGRPMDFFCADGERRDNA